MRTLRVPSGLSIVLAAAVLILSVAGCSVGPDYVAPQYDVPDAWHTSAARGVTDGSAGVLGAHVS